MLKKQKNYRLPSLTLKQIADLQERTGMTETQVIIRAIDRMAHEVMKRTEDSSVSASNSEASTKTSDSD